MVMTTLALWRCGTAATGSSWIIELLKYVFWGAELIYEVTEAIQVQCHMFMVILDPKY